MMKQKSKQFQHETQLPGIISPPTLRSSLMLSCALHSVSLVLYNFKHVNSDYQHRDEQSLSEHSTSSTVLPLLVQQMTSFCIIYFFSSSLHCMLGSSYSWQSDVYSLLCFLCSAIFSARRRLVRDVPSCTGQLDVCFFVFLGTGTHTSC